jgi:hypothetical protein
MEHFSWFTLIGLGKYDYILGSILVVILLALAGFSIKKSLSKEGSVLPDEKFSIRNIFEILTIDFLFDLFTNMCWKKDHRHFSSIFSENKTCRKSVFTFKKQAHNTCKIIFCLFKYVQYIGFLGLPVSATTFYIQIHLSLRQEF